MIARPFDPGRHPRIHPSSSLPNDADHGSAPSWLGPTRIGIGLLQGLLLYLLYMAAQDKVWPATAPLLFAPLVLAGALLPLIVVSSLGRTAPRALLPWVVVAWLLPCMRYRGAECDAFVIDLDGDARPEVILIAKELDGNAVLRQSTADSWEFAGRIGHDIVCPATVQAMREGKMHTVAPPLADLDVDGRRVQMLSRHKPAKCE